MQILLNAMCQYILSALPELTHFIIKGPGISLIFREEEEETEAQRG